MKQFKVTCKVLYWFDEVRLVEAESEEDIDDEAIKNGEIIASDLDTLDQINEIDSIEPLDSDELEYEN
jgi:hypothetical protein